MAVAPLNLPGYATPQSLDFSSLANLGQVYKQANQDATRQATLAQLGQGDKIDPRVLLASGDMSLANLGVTLQNQQTQGERDSRDFAFREQESKRAQSNADRSYGLQAAANARAGDKTPTGFERDPATGGLKPIAGGPADPNYRRTVTDKQNAPSGYKWADPSNPEAGLVAIPGGPGEKIPAEVAARLGLAKSFLGQLPEIRKRVEAGEATGIIDGAMGAANMGGSGEIRRQIASGAEALLRNLTGAGMNIDEAKKYVARYQPQINDSAKTIGSKLDQLERELRSVNDIVSQGRGGSVLERPSASTARPQAASTKPISQQQYEALPSGSTFTAPDGTQRVKP